MKIGYARSPSSTVTVFSTLEEEGDVETAIADTAGDRDLEEKAGTPLSSFFWASTALRLHPRKQHWTSIREFRLTVGDKDSGDVKGVTVRGVRTLLLPRADAEALRCIRLI